MILEDKELLLKDLCARLPYGVKIDREWISPMSGSPEHSIMELDTFDIEIIKTSIELGKEGNCRGGKMKGLTICDDGKNHFVRGYMGKSYLRPMSSMTEEEENEWCGFNIDPLLEAVGKPHTRTEDLVLRAKSQYEPLDWLNAHHFDFRGLIPKGLALEAPEGMYKNN